MTQRASCLRRSAEDHFLQIHQDDIDICEGNVTAAALLSFFEWWHNHKLIQQEKARQANDVAEIHGELRSQDESLWQWHTEAEMEAAIKIAGRKTIATAIKWLETHKFITTGRNPNPRFAFDRTRFFLLHPECVNTALEGLEASRKNTLSSRKNTSPCGKKAAPSRQNTATIPEITPKITPETKTPPLTPPTEGKRPHKKAPPSPEAIEVLTYLCAKTGRSFTKTEQIDTLLKTGVLVEDCKVVIDFGVVVLQQEWGDKYERYFDNVTPFRPLNFDRYHARALQWRKTPLTAQNGYVDSLSGETIIPRKMVL